MNLTLSADIAHRCVRDHAALVASCVKAQGSADEPRYGSMAALGCRCPALEGPMLVGTHHKMGTVLIEQILLEIVKMQGPNASVAKPHWSSCPKSPPSSPPTPVRRAPACIDEHVQQPPARQPWVHLVRDPVEVAISDYQYSRTGAEGWLRAPRCEGCPSLQQQLLAANASEGLKITCERVVPSVRAAAALYRRARREPTCLTIRYEELASAFDYTVERLVAFFGAVPDGHGAAATRERLLRAASRHDLSGRGGALKAHEAKHVSNASEKDALRATLLGLDGCGAALRAAQSALEYPASGREGLEATSALRRRWLRAITVRSEVRPPQLLNTRFGSEVSLPVEVIDF
jgi:hypothetical protein